MMDHPCGCDESQRLRAELERERADAQSYARSLLVEQERRARAEAEVERLRAVLETIERTGAPGGAMFARRQDAHACVWCRRMYTPCPLEVATAALRDRAEAAEAQHEEDKRALAECAQHHAADRDAAIKRAEATERMWGEANVRAALAESDSDAARRDTWEPADASGETTP